MSTRPRLPPSVPSYHHHHRPSTAALPASTAASTSSQQPERVCDTIPVPHNLIVSRLVHVSDSPPHHPHPSVSDPSSRSRMGTSSLLIPSQLHTMDIDTTFTNPIPDTPALKLTAPGSDNPRKLCVRHQRMADEGTTNKMQHVCPFSPISPPFSSAPSRPLAHLTISRASMPSHSQNAKPSAISGPPSPLPLI
jgi:hypothetical protein